MGRVSPGICGGTALSWSGSRARARATRGSSGRWRVTVIVSGAKGMSRPVPRMTGDGAVFVVVAQVGVERVPARARRCGRAAGAPSAGHVVAAGGGPPAPGGRSGWRAVSPGARRGPSSRCPAGGGRRRSRARRRGSGVLDRGRAPGWRAGPQGRVRRRPGPSRPRGGGVRACGPGCRRSWCSPRSRRRSHRSRRCRNSGGVLQEFSFRHLDFSQPSSAAGHAPESGQDLQDDPPVLEQGDLPGGAVVLELDFLVGPGDLGSWFTVITDRTGSMPGMASGARR